MSARPNRTSQCEEWAVEQPSRPRYWRLRCRKAPLLPKGRSDWRGLQALGAQALASALPSPAGKRSPRRALACFPRRTGHPPRRSKKSAVVLYDRTRDWLFLIEAVTSNGPVSPKRIVEIEKMLAACTAGPVYVSAYPDMAEFKRSTPGTSPGKSKRGWLERLITLSISTAIGFLAHAQDSSRWECSAQPQLWPFRVSRTPRSAFPDSAWQINSTGAPEHASRRGHCRHLTGGYRPVSLATLLSTRRLSPFGQGWSGTPRVPSPIAS